MDAAHAALLREPHVAPFFDPNLQRNQYLSEFALHRSLLAYSRRVLSPADADFFFVPFYARLAYADKVATKRVRRLQKNLTGTLARCLADSPHWQASRGRDHFVTMSSTRDPRKLFGPAWPMLADAVLLRIDNADFRYGNLFGGSGGGGGGGGGGGRKRRRGEHAFAEKRQQRRRRGRRAAESHGGGGGGGSGSDNGGGDNGGGSGGSGGSGGGASVGRAPSIPAGSGAGRRLGGGGDGDGGGGSTIVIPYYVPHYPEEAAIRPAQKRYDVCFFGSATNKVRKRALAALRGVPNTALALSGKASFDAAVDVVQSERRRTLRTRVILRQCKLCLVPAGMTPSSRRYYEAVAAKCVPVLLADHFEPAFASLVPIERYAVRAPQATPEHLPAVVRAALQRWPRLYAGVERARPALLFDLGFDSSRASRAGGDVAGDATGVGGGGEGCDAAHAVLMELRTRFYMRSAQKHRRGLCLGTTARDGAELAAAGEGSSLAPCARPS